MTRQALMAAASTVLAISLAGAAGSAPVSDLSITNTDFAVTYTAGSATTYTIVVSNAGPDPVTGATVSDAVTSLPQISGVSWTCVATGGATCSAGPLATPINDVITLPVGGTATYTLFAALRSAGTGTMVNTATVTVPAGTTDPNSANNTAVDSNAAAKLLYVATTVGTDVATCGASTAPCKTIQYTVNNLAHSGDTVVAAAGTYAECVVLPVGGALGGVRLESDEHLASGSNAVTFLDGLGVCDALSATPGPVITVNDRSAVHGFTIRNGGTSGVLASGTVTIFGNLISGNATAGAGGGINLQNAGVASLAPPGKTSIRFNSILSNTAATDGGGLFVGAVGNFGQPSVIEILNNIVSGNTAGNGSVGAAGGGMAIVIGTASAADSASVVVSGNTLNGNIAKNATGNTAFADGAGIFVTSNLANSAGTDSVTIGSTGSGNSLRNNVSDGYGGGIGIDLHPGPGGTHTVDIAANTISANTGTRGGGGAHLDVHAVDRTAGASPNIVLRVAGNSFVGNHSQGTLADPNAAGGGGVYAELHSDRTAAAAVSFELSGNTIERNDAAPFGGGVSVLASADDDPANDGATAPADAVIALRNDLIAANAAHDTTAAGVSGGGVHALLVARGGLSTARLTQDFLTIASNQTELGSGGLEWEDLRPTDTLGLAGTTSFELSNSIVSSNDGYGVGGTILPGAGTTVAVSYTDAFGNGSADYEAQLGVAPGTNGNISVDPRLDVLFLPRICGPTIDIGDPAIPATLEPLPNGGRVNLGHLGNTASATRTFPDINGDGTIDGLDMLGVAVSFGAMSPDPRYFPAADRDFDLIVDGNDLAYVSAFFAQSCP